MKLQPSRPDRPGCSRPFTIRFGTSGSRRILRHRFAFKGLAFALAVAALAVFTGKAAAGDFWPLYESSENSTTILYPFYVHEEDFFMIFPFYAKKREWNSKSIWIMPYFRKSSPGKTDSWLFPLFRKLSSKSKSILWILPFYHERSPMTSKDWFLPFYGKSRDGNWKGLWIAPFFRESYPGGTESKVYPVYEKVSTEDENIFKLGPYFQERSDTRSITSLFPFFGKKSEELLVLRTYSGKILELEACMYGPPTGFKATTAIRDTFNIFGLYERQTTTSLDDVLVRRYRRFLFFSNELNAEGVHTHRIFGRRISECRK